MAGTPFRACFPLLLLFGLSFPPGCSTGQTRGEASEVDVNERLITRMVEVDAPPEVVFDAWTRTEGITTFFAPKAKIDAVEGGAFELYFDPSQPEGLRGSEGCTFRTIERPDRLVTTWSFPPSIPELRDKGALTRLTITLMDVSPDPDTPRTLVTVVHDQWRQGEAWDRGLAYFERAWPRVLENLRKRFAEGPIDWSAE